MLLLIHCLWLLSLLVGVLCLCFVCDYILLFRSLCHSSVAITLIGVARSAVCDCSISWSYLLAV